MVLLLSMSGVGKSAGLGRILCTIMGVSIFEGTFDMLGLVNLGDAMHKLNTFFILQTIRSRKVDRLFEKEVQVGFLTLFSVYSR